MRSMCSTSIRPDTELKDRLKQRSRQRQEAKYKVHLKHLCVWLMQLFHAVATHRDGDGCGGGEQILIDIFGQCNVLVRQLFDNSWPTFSLLTR